MQITITQITKPVWKAGILHDTFRGDGWHGDCNCCIVAARCRPPA